jgi:hypothetical protein
LENERREEKEHEMHMMQMVMGYPPVACTPVYTNHQQQEQPGIRNNTYAFETAASNSLYDNLSSRASSYSYGGSSADSNASSDNSNSYFVL